MDIHEFGCIPIVIKIPDNIQYLFPGDDMVNILYQIQQQIVFLFS